MSNESQFNESRSDQDRSDKDRPKIVTLSPMTQAEYDEYEATAQDGYAESIASSGSLPHAEALERAAADFARLLPQGLQTAEMLFFTARDGQDQVGRLWLHVHEGSEGLEAFGYDFDVREDLRQQGYGAAIMLAAERHCREMGVLTVGLNVFGDNVIARSLYERMGFEVTSIRMRKRLT